jgi:hypothetical protein
MRPPYGRLRRSARSRRSSSSSESVRLGRGSMSAPHEPDHGLLRPARL